MQGPAGLKQMRIGADRGSVQTPSGIGTDLMKSRYYLFRQLGGPEVLEMREETLDPPGPGQVLVKQKFIGLNFTDINLRRGDHPEPPLFPHRIGQEAAGIVAAVGPGVTEFAPGSRVAYATRPPAAYCEARLIAADRLVPVPDAVSLAAAASGLLKGMTAEFLIHRTIAVQPGDYVIVYAAAGGVGQIMCRWLAAKGAQVIPVVGSKAKLSAARAASGCDTVLVLHQDDIAACVRSLTGGQMADIVYDSLGAVSFEHSLAALRPRGMFVAFGAASGQIPPMAPIRLGAQGSLIMTWARIGDYIATRKELTSSAARVFQAHEQGIITLQPQQVFAFDEAARAHRAMERRELSGSSVLSVPE